MVLLNVNQLGAGFTFGISSRAQPGNVFRDSRVTAQDAPNAAALTGYGYTAVPATNWTTGQAITINGFQFNWTGSAWAAGVHALMAPTDASGYPADGTIDDVKAWVGTDAERARYALDMETMRPAPRSSLAAWLNKLIGD